MGTAILNYGSLSISGALAASSAYCAENKNEDNFSVRLFGFSPHEAALTGFCPLLTVRVLGDSLTEDARVRTGRKSYFRL